MDPIVDERELDEHRSFNDQGAVIVEDGNPVLWCDVGLTVRFGNGIDKIAKAIDNGIDAVEGEISETLKESGGPSLGKPLKENANMVASMVEEVQKSVTDLTKPLLDEDDEESKEWGDDDLADW